MSPLAPEEIERRLAGAGDWQRDGEAAIVRELTLPDFTAAVAFVNQVAELSEAADHHPDILLHGWNKVLLTLSTHSEGGLTDADFQLASQIDRIA